MTLDDLFGAFRTGCADLTHWLWPDASLTDLQRDEDWLKLRLRRGYDALLRQRNLIERLQSRIAHNGKDETALTYRIETYLHVDNRVKAYHHALELDQIRHRLERDGDELQHLDKAYGNQVEQLADMERCLAQVQERLEALRLRPAGMNAW